MAHKTKVISTSYFNYGKIGKNICFNLYRVQKVMT